MLVKHLAFERTLLQLAIFVLACVPILAGADGMISGSSLISEGPIEINLDSHLRYLSGLLFGIGLCFWSTIPNIERKVRTFRFLTFIVVTGGLARLGGLVFAGRPSDGMLFGLAMELLVTPLLCLWQARIASMHDKRKFLFY